MQSTRFKICVIGCGEIAFGYHGPAYDRYARENPNVELSGCCSRTAQKAIDFSRTFGFKRSYTDYKEMIGVEKPDAVCLNVSPQAICELTCTILRMGIPIILEKPPGLTVAEIDRMIEAVEETNTPNQVAFNRRFMPLVQALKHILDGKFLAQEIHHVQINFTRTNRGSEDFSTTAIHGIDLARFLAGSDFAAIKFHYQELPSLGPQVVNVLMDGTFHSGATAHLSFYPVAGLVTERVLVHAANNTFYLHLPVWNAIDSPGRLTQFEAGKQVYDISGSEVAGASDDFVLNGFYEENKSFFAHVLAGTPPTVDIKKSKQSVEIMQCMRERRMEYPYS